MIPPLHIDSGNGPICGYVWPIKHDKFGEETTGFPKKYMDDKNTSLRPRCQLCIKVYMERYSTFYRW